MSLAADPWYLESNPVADTPSTPPPPFAPAAPAVAAPGESIDRPACFYLGQEYDLTAKAVLANQIVMYDARNLTTHGVIVGMTGSGKTGLSIALLEEAAIDGIPAIIIDPKGDLTNLLLQFPDLDPRDFAAWLNPDDARQKNLTVEQYSEQLAQRWRQGLLESKQQPERVRELSKDTDFRIYTPGSEAGLALSVLRTFSAPKGELLAEDLTQKINATATALLGLTGLSADPVQSREHVLVARLLQNAWSEKRDLDLAGLIKEIQSPPISTVGAYNLETFFPGKERLKFASQLNNVLASPIFATWTAGEPLDLAGMLYRNGRPQHLIFYLAHLDDNQRMFFTTLLLEEVLSWTRRQSGSASLRALLYFDEVFGYMPPHPANPPSKAPLLTLLKQARAFGVGVLLATQNPVDLDYKALSNAGTWFVGKLQTERDKARLLEGLESVASEHGTLTDRHYLEKVIASLGNRIFLMHDINQGKPRLFRSRWALTFLRGPMTRLEVERITKQMKERDKLGSQVAQKLCNHCGTKVPAGVGNLCPKCGKNPWGPAAEGTAAAPMAQLMTGLEATAAAAAMPAGKAAPGGGQSSVRYTQPVLPPDVTQFYVPVAGPAPAGQEIEYRPYVLGFAELVFTIDKRKGVEHKAQQRLLAEAPAPGHPVNWEKPIGGAFTPASRPEPKARWASVPASLDTARKLKSLEKAFADFVYSTQKLSLFQNRELELMSQAGESEQAFRARCQTAAVAQALQALEMERVKFTPKFNALDATLPEDKQEAKAGDGLLDYILKQARSTKGHARPPADKQEEKEEKVRKLEEKVRKLEADYESKRNGVAEKWKRVGEEASPIQVKPRKSDIRVTHFGIAWAPFWVGVALR